MTETAFGNYVLGLAGVSLLRRWYTSDAPVERQRLLELASGYDDNELLNFRFATPEHDAKAGYTLWATSYDGANPMIEMEQRILDPRLAELFVPGMRALDAGCGTGRHAETLVSIGYDVIGTDLTPAMLDVARSKVPAADFREGVFEALPVESGSVDLVVSALAVCHAIDLDVVFGEFARVLRPGGRIIVSDPHPGSGPFGAQAFFAGDGFDLPFVRNRAHAISDYITAMLAHGLQIEAMVELPYDEQVLASNPAQALFPEATSGALLDIPFLVVFEASLG